MLSHDTVVLYHTNLHQDVENEYLLKTFSTCPRNVTRDFPAPDQHGRILIKFHAHTDTPLPHPELLRVHAALAHILHAPDIAERIAEAGYTTEPKD